MPEEIWAAVERKVRNMRRPPRWLRSHRPGTAHRETSACVLKKGSGFALRKDRALHFGSMRALSLAGILLWPQEEAAWCSRARRHQARRASAGLSRVLSRPQLGLPLAAPLAVPAAAATQPRLPGPHGAPCARARYRPLPANPGSFSAQYSSQQQLSHVSYLTPLLLIHHSPTPKLPRSCCQGLWIFSQPSHMLPVITLSNNILSLLVWLHPVLPPLHEFHPMSLPTTHKIPNLRTLIFNPQLARGRKGTRKGAASNSTA